MEYTRVLNQDEIDALLDFDGTYEVHRKHKMVRDYFEKWKYLHSNYEKFKNEAYLKDIHDPELTRLLSVLKEEADRMERRYRVAFRLAKP